MSTWRGAGGGGERDRRVKLTLRHHGRVSALGARTSSPPLQMIVVLLVARAGGGVPVPCLAVGVVSTQLAALLDGLRLLLVDGASSVVYALFIFRASRLTRLLCSWR